MENKMTAVEWLEKTLLDLSHPKHRALLYPFFEHAKAMEKKQIMNAYEFGVGDAYNYTSEEGELFYNETYGKQ